MTTATESPVCPLCRSPRTRRLFPVGGFSIWRCSDCGGGFATPVPQRSEVGAIYDDGYGGEYLEGVMHSEAFAQARFDMVLHVLGEVVPSLLAREGRRVLDVGCGSGRFLALLGRSGWRTVGVEMSPPLASYAREQMGLEVIEHDFLSTPPVGRFDLVTMFHVIEHFVDPVAAIRQARKLLDHGGAVYIETPNWESIGARLRGPRWSHFIPPEHLVYLGPRSVVRLAEACRFETAMCRTTTPPVIESIRRLPRPIRELGRGAYRVASRLGYGPALQYMGLVR
jgi:SAM-dependent methyltransferase